MSLSSLLLTNATNGGQANVDTALDELFRSHSAKQVTSTPEPQSTSNLAGAKRKRKREAAAEVKAAAPSSPGPTAPSRKTSKHKSVEMTSRKSRSVPKEVVDGDERIAKDDDRASSSDSDNDDLLETAYLAKKTRLSQNRNTEVLRHETSSNNPPDARDHPRKKVKYVPPDETPAQRDSRTIFVGNIPIIVAKSKSHQKLLKRHVLSYVADAKIESLRFRSVAFANATAPIPVEDGKSASGTTATTSTKQQRQKERAAAWREVGAESSNKEDSKKPRNEQKFLTPAEKKRVAFIKGDFHKEVDTVNAYIVFAHQPPHNAEDILHPAEAAHLAVVRCDGSVFLERTLRVDHVGHKPGAEHGDGGGRPPTDVNAARATLFVGNLDFAAREEDLRVWFEGVVGQVLGPRQGDRGDGEEEEEEEKRWVQSVRIVRDPDTQLGKGFAYVRFADQECVDEVLVLDHDSLKFAKRKLRVQRCKVNPVAASKPKATSVHASAAQKKTTRVKPEPVSVPAGDPSLGEKLAGLSKEERKATKAANVDRVQRRLAKKKARMNAERDQAQQRRSRVRDRRRRNDDKEGRSKPAKKARVRSLSSLAKKNTKK